MPKSEMPAHLITINGVKKCSKCGKAFPEDSKPSVSKAFGTHLREAHGSDGKPKSDKGA